MKVHEFTEEYEAKLRLIPLPKGKEEKIVYFLWLDDQVMELWSEYLNMKCFFGDNTEEDEEYEDDEDEDGYYDENGAWHGRGRGRRRKGYGRGYGGRRVS